MPAGPPDHYFRLFNLPAAFEIDAADLAVRYRELQRAVHPDRFAAGSDAERVRAVQQAAEVNDAFQTLKDPVRRARYLLMLRGVDTEDETDTVMDPAFLMEQMDLREQLEHVRSPAAPSASDALLALRERLTGRFSETMRAFGASLAEDDLEGARGRARELQFLRKLLNEADSIGEEP
ncbi:MAG: Fe-S protein assembly co-chaperone HscB [Acidiferrobacteraceae bacterium]